MEPANTAPKPFVFVLMPFAPEFDDVYKPGIKPACQDAGAYAERVDEQFYEGGILQRIYNQISKADVIVAGMTGKNPNVFYETGYAHALGKPAILLTRNADDIPFDLKHHPHIVYKGRISDLKPELTKRVSWAVQQPKTANRMDTVEVYVKGKSLIEEGRIDLPLKKEGSLHTEIEFAVHNVTMTRSGKSLFQIGLIEHKGLDYLYDLSARPNRLFAKYEQPDGERFLHLSSRIIEILPDAWESVRFSLRAFESRPFYIQKAEKMELKIYSENGPCSFPFELNFFEQEET